MPIPSLKNIISNGRSTVASASGTLDKFARAAGTGGFSVSADPEGGISVNINFNKLLQNRKIGNRIVTQLKELYDPSNGRVYDPIIFPDDLDNEHYMLFNVMKRNRPSAQAQVEKRPIRSIVLPIPSNLSVAYGTDYGNENLGIFGAAASGRLKLPSSLTDNDLANIVTQRIAQVEAALQSGRSDSIDSARLQALGTLGPAVATAAATLGAGAVGGLLAFGGTVGGVISGIGVDEGIAINPHMAVLFRGINFREHSFAYRFIARNQTESDRIRELIQVIKFHMHPGYSTGNLAFTYPDEFEIEFSQKLSPYLYTIGTSVLKNLTVNYNGENMPIFFEQTGAPVIIDITMAFQETKLLTREKMDTHVSENFNGSVR